MKRHVWQSAIVLLVQTLQFAVIFGLLYGIKRYYPDFDDEALLAILFVYVLVVGPIAGVRLHRISVTSAEWLIGTTAFAGILILLLPLVNGNNPTYSILIFPVSIAIGYFPALLHSLITRRVDRPAVPEEEHSNLPKRPTDLEKPPALNPWASSKASPKTDQEYLAPIPTPTQKGSELMQNSSTATSGLLPISTDLLQEYLRKEGYVAGFDAQWGVFTFFPLEKELGFRPKLWLIPSGDNGRFFAITIVGGDIPKAKWPAVNSATCSFNQGGITFSLAYLVTERSDGKTANLYLCVPVIGRITSEDFQDILSRCKLGALKLHELLQKALPETGSSEVRNLDPLSDSLLERVIKGFDLSFKRDDNNSIRIQIGIGTFISVNIRNLNGEEVLQVISGKRHQLAKSEIADALLYCNTFNGYSLKGHVHLDYKDDDDELRLTYMARTNLSLGTTESFLRDYLKRVFGEISWFVKDAQPPWRFDHPEEENSAPSQPDQLVAPRPPSQPPTAPRAHW